jgi:cell shape-determining protein MreC
MVMIAMRSTKMSPHSEVWVTTWVSSSYNSFLLPVHVVRGFTQTFVRLYLSKNVPDALHLKLKLKLKHLFLNACFIVE